MKNLSTDQIIKNRKIAIGTGAALIVAIVVFFIMYSGNRGVGTYTALSYAGLYDKPGEEEMTQVATVQPEEEIRVTHVSTSGWATVDYPGHGKVLLLGFPVNRIPASSDKLYDSFKTEVIEMEESPEFLKGFSALLKALPDALAQQDPAQLAMMAAELLFLSGLHVLYWVIMFFYLLKWQSMRRWFNRRGGRDFMPVSRIERPQTIAITVGVIMTVVFIVGGMLGDDLSSTADIFSLLAYAFFAVYCIRKYKRDKREIGKRAAKWYAIYTFVSCVVVASLSALISTWAIMIYLIYGFLTAKGSSNEDYTETVTLEDGTELKGDGTHYRSKDGRHWRKRADGPFETY
ncbi:MAG: hypothetical protein LBP56_10360 [Odoribacteraceae bacterium]|nr:hypothetical protein [Odoribacteraceae bacterium]